ncbi:hypothetical protein JHK87_027135 [Glycine soja]|nr:hypothetical protein JHK87_027135 [Glycine soja]
MEAFIRLSLISCEELSKKQTAQESTIRKLRAQIGNTIGLLPKIIDFTHSEERLLKNENVSPCKILRVKRSLQPMKMLATTTGAMGNIFEGRFQR